MNTRLSEELERMAAHVETSGKLRDRYNPNPESYSGNSEFLLRDIYTFLDPVVELREYLEENHPEFLERRPEMFDGIIASLLERDRIMQEIQAALTEGIMLEPRRLRELADHYEAIVRASTEYRKAIGRYLDAADK